jgi:hypothetical protein
LLLGLPSSKSNVAGRFSQEPLSVLTNKSVSIGSFDKYYKVSLVHESDGVHLQVDILRFRGSREYNPLSKVNETKNI